jgi:hypothetical protein
LPRKSPFAGDRKGFSYATTHVLRPKEKDLKKYSKKEQDYWEYNQRRVMKPF